MRRVLQSHQMIGALIAKVIGTKFLGLTVRVIVHELDDEERREAAEATQFDTQEQEGR